MAETGQKEENHSKSKLEEWLHGADIKKLGSVAIPLVLGIALLISMGIKFLGGSEGSHVKENKALGRAYIYLNRGQNDSAKAFLEQFLSQSQPPLVMAKANLLLGKANFILKRYSESVEAYSKVKESGVKDPLLMSGALHGMAAGYMEQGDFSNAVPALETFIANYKRRTGDLKERSKGEEPEDLSPSVANALWKLALCYRQLGQEDKAKETCDTIVKVYGDKEEAGKASRLLQTI